MANLAELTNYSAEAADNFDPLPPAEYTMAIVDGELRDTKAEGGKYIRWTWKVLGGEFDGRLVWQNINLINKNPKAAEIGQRELAQIRQAIGKPNASDTNDYMHIPCIVRVGIERNSGEYAPQNEIKAVKAVAGNSFGQPPAYSAPAQQQAPAQPSSPAQAGGQQRPWG